MIRKIFDTTCNMAFGIGCGIGMGVAIWGAGFIYGGSLIMNAQRDEEKARKEVAEEDDTEDLYEIE